MKLNTIDLKNIKITDSFWSKHVDLVRKEIIPYQWAVMNDEIKGAETSRCLENFKIAARLTDGEFYGAVFQDTDIAKWLEAVGFTLANYKDEELERLADDAIDIIGKAQQPDGYLNTYFTIKEPDKRWRNLAEGHELYTAGHMMEAAVAYYQGTGKRKFLDIMEKNAELICNIFGAEEGKIHGYPGHQEIEIGLIKLYHVTGKKKYLDTAKYFIDARGVGENYFLKEREQSDFNVIFKELWPYDPSYSQSHLPVREQTTAEGHSVRAVYMYTAMAELAYEYQDADLMKACETLWDNIVNKRMYITGGIGSSGLLERFTVDYDLPNDRCYCESCASIGLMMFGQRMLNITGDSRYADVIEKALYNTVLAGVALDGKSFFYVNPLEVWPDNCKDRTSMEHVKPIRQKWFAVACCPPNIARTLASLGQYIYSVGEESIYLNLYISNETIVHVKDQDVTIKIETEFPNCNEVKVEMKNIPEDGLVLALRIPDYAMNYVIVQENGSGESIEVAYAISKGYACISVEEEGVYTVTFEAPARLLRTNPKVPGNIGKVAAVRGPLVYCAEEVDNGKGLQDICIDMDKTLKEVNSNKFGGIVELTLEGERMELEDIGNNLYFEEKNLNYKKTAVKMIPYAYWNNRGEGEMSVWMKVKY